MIDNSRFCAYLSLYLPGGFFDFYGLSKAKGATGGNNDGLYKPN
jgi:hypothetical protein